MSVRRCWSDPAPHDGSWTPPATHRGDHDHHPGAEGRRSPRLHRHDGPCRPPCSKFVGNRLRRAWTSGTCFACMPHAIGATASQGRDPQPSRQSVSRSRRSAHDEIPVPRRRRPAVATRGRATRLVAAGLRRRCAPAGSGSRAGSWSMRKPVCPPPRSCRSRRSTSSHRIFSCISASRLPRHRWIPNPNDICSRGPLAIDDELVRLARCAPRRGCRRCTRSPPCRRP